MRVAAAIAIVRAVIVIAVVFVVMMEIDIGIGGGWIETDDMLDSDDMVTSCKMTHVNVGFS